MSHKLREVYREATIAKTVRASIPRPKSVFTYIPASPALNTLSLAVYQVRCAGACPQSEEVYPTRRSSMKNARKAKPPKTCKLCGERVNWIWLPTGEWHPVNPGKIITVACRHQGLVAGPQSHRSTCAGSGASHHETVR